MNFAFCEKGKKFAKLRDHHTPQRRHRWQKTWWQKPACWIHTQIFSKTKIHMILIQSHSYSPCLCWRDDTMKDFDWVTRRVGRMRHPVHSLRPLARPARSGKPGKRIQRWKNIASLHMEKTMMKKKRKKTLKKRATSRKTPQNLHMSHANRWPGVPAKHDYQHHPAPVAQYGTEEKTRGDFHWCYIAQVTE